MATPLRHRSDFLKIFAATALSTLAGAGVDVLIRPFENGTVPGQMLLAVGLWLGAAFLTSLGLVRALTGTGGSGGNPPGR